MGRVERQRELARRRKRRVLTQETIARMDRVAPRLRGDCDQLLDVEIGPGSGQAELVGFIRLEAVQAQFVLFGKDRDRLFAHFVGGAHDTDGDFTTVGNQDLFEVGHEVRVPLGRLCADYAHHEGRCNTQFWGVFACLRRTTLGNLIGRETLDVSRGLGAQ